MKRAVRLPAHIPLGLSLREARGPRLDHDRAAIPRPRAETHIDDEEIGVRGVRRKRFLTVDDNAGSERWTERFHGIPMRRVDALSADEARVT